MDATAPLEGRPPAGPQKRGPPWKVVPYSVELLVQMREERLSMEWGWMSSFILDQCSVGKVG